MIRVWGRADAFNVQKALWALGEVGRPFERIDLPHVEAWYRRLGERPAYRGSVMQPFDHLRGRSGF